ncbi:MAG: BON domain-containing protein [Acidobacteriota bacterium]
MTRRSSSPSSRTGSSWVALSALVAAAALLATSFLAAPALAEPNPSASTTVNVYSDLPEVIGDNTELEQDIRRVLDRTLARNIFDWVYATVEGDTVVLHGWVYYGSEAERIARGIAKIDGVAVVENRVELLSVSTFDDRLRVETARAIYRHPLFNQYPRLGTLPVHILVDGGRITLEGTVNTRAEAYAAELAARSQVTSFGVDSNLRVASELTP